MDPESIIEIVSCGGNFMEMAARYGVWDRPTMQLIAFRVIKEHKAPREIWVVNGQVYDSRPQGTIPATHFREVIE